MPELPEVETIVRSLRRHVIGDVIEFVWIGERRQPLKSTPSEIASVLEGSRIAAVRRMGKHIVINLVIGRSGDRVIETGPNPHPVAPPRLRSGQAPPGATRVGQPLRSNLRPRSPDDPITRSPDQFIVHLGMTGRLLISRADEPIARHTHLIARLRSGRELRFTDARMFGKLAVVREPFHTAGAEPLEIPFADFAALFRRRKMPIKSALLNQALLRGIGNIYADESLYRAGLRPRRRAASLTRAGLQRLYDSVRQVLKEAIAAGGSSVSDYVDASGERGFFQLQHRVYGREGEPCLACGAPIKRIVIAGRSSHYCPKCQK